MLDHTFTKHQRCRRITRCLVNNLLRTKLPASAVRTHHVFRYSLSLNLNPCAVQAERTSRMCLHEVDLALEFRLIRPIVIALTHRNIFSSRSREIKRSTDVRESLRVLIFCLKNRENPVRIALCILPNDLSCAICRSVIVNQKLPLKIRFLFDKSIQSIPNIRLLIVGDTADADHDLPFI